MIRIIVRAKKDADAVKAMLRTFYQGWDIEVTTLKGARGEKGIERLHDVLSNEYYNIVLIGRQDKEFLKLDGMLGANTVIHMVPKEKIRNTRISQLASEFERARARFRLETRWNNEGYVFSIIKRGVRLPIEVNPAFDVFLENKNVVSKYLGIYCKGCDYLVFIRKFSGEHDIFCGKNLIAKIKIPDRGYVEVYEKRDTEGSLVNLKKTLENNIETLHVMEKISTKLLKNVKNKHDVYIVPWSGGKDSTTALILAVKVFGRKKLYAIYVDTGVDFPHNREYVEKVSRKLGVNLIVEEAHVDEELSKGRRFPTNEDRWCTKLKIAALYRAIDSIADSRDKVLIIMGDRDAESELRSKRPPIRGHEGFMQVAPIKMWSAAHTQLYLLQNNIPLNPLYELGFYRLGCYICPALRSWEIMIMKSTPLKNILDNLPFYKEFITSFREIGNNRE